MERINRDVLHVVLWNWEMVSPPALRNQSFTRFTGSVVNDVRYEHSPWLLAASTTATAAAAAAAAPSDQQEESDDASSQEIVNAENETLT